MLKGLSIPFVGDREEMKRKSRTLGKDDSQHKCSVVKVMMLVKRCLLKARFFFNGL